VALQLRRRGITRVRPLAGGLEAWIAAGFASVEISPGAPTSDEIWDGQRPRA
jgi:hypothetical protein